MGITPVAGKVTCRNPVSRLEVILTSENFPGKHEAHHRRNPVSRLEVILTTRLTVCAFKSKVMSQSSISPGSDSDQSAAGC